MGCKPPAGLGRGGVAHRGLGVHRGRPLCEPDEGGCVKCEEALTLPPPPSPRGPGPEDLRARDKNLFIQGRGRAGAGLHRNVGLSGSKLTRLGSGAGLALAERRDPRQGLKSLGGRERPQWGRGHTVQRWWEPEAGPRPHPHRAEGQWGPSRFRRNFHNTPQPTGCPAG